ncbi:uncharacterized protein [Clytia hemisphaerica]|uniref:uncharacterized protein n=1 Tax=Clytia hemisphaerica TaxID=252671 RepID=UPI0034D75C1A
MKSLIVFLFLVISLAKGNVLKGPCGSLATKCYNDLLFRGKDFIVCEDFVRCEYLEDGNIPREQCVQRCADIAIDCEKQYPYWMWWLKFKRTACGTNGYKCLNGCKQKHDSAGRKRTMLKDFGQFEEQKRGLYEDARRNRRMETKQPQHDDFNEYYDFAFDKY